MNERRKQQSPWTLLTCRALRMSATWTRARVPWCTCGYAQLRHRTPPSHLRPVDFNTTECRFQFARQSLHNNMAWMTDTSTWAEKGTRKQEKRVETEERKEESTVGDKLQTGTITWDFGHLRCVASDLRMDGISWAVSTPISILRPSGNHFTKCW